MAEGVDRAAESWRAGGIPGYPGPGPPAAETDRPVPARYWWLKRMGGFVLVYVVFLLGIRLWWGYVADQRLARVLEVARAEGEPLMVEDFQLPGLPDEENAAYYLMQAADQLVSQQFTTTQPNALVESALAGAAPEPGAGEFLVGVRSALDLLRRARSCERADWGLSLATPAVGMVLPMLSPQRNLARCGITAAHIQHCAGDDGAAIETLRDVWAAAGHVDATFPCLISTLVGFAICGLVTSEIEATLPDLRIAGEEVLSAGATGDDTTSRTAGPASPGQVRALIADLLDEEPARTRWRYNLLGERMMMLDTLLRASPRSLAALGINLPPDPYVSPIGPLKELDAAFMLETLNGNIAAARAPSYPAARALMPPGFALPARFPQKLTYVYTAFLLPSFERAHQVHFRMLAQRRLAAAGLALRLYEAEHGRRAETLAALVPEYLPGVPLDPFAADGRPLRYLPDDPQPRLYSVGVNGTDDGGRHQSVRNSQHNLNQIDITFFLTGARPRTATSAPASAPATSTSPAE